VLARHGADPREFVLLPFGGAGPMMACFLARELGIARVLVPAAPGVLSALGGLVSDVKNDFIRTVYVDLTAETLAALHPEVAALEREALDWYREELNRGEAPALRYSADMRYAGQSFEIEVPLPAEALANGDPDAIARAFHAEHERLYDYSDPSAPVQLINLRLVLLAPSPRPAVRERPASAAEPGPERTLAVTLEGRARQVPLYLREALGPGARLNGPAIIAQDDATTCVLDGFSIAADRYGNLLLEAVSG
jgi:N-methylhydantoinase A